ncbi:MAG: type III-B CRISPR module RAMP protein Cmr6 [Fimbriimonadaceae bacterium]|nr:type III-B CRISPR module RAMP protein Cmr6 [Fimbriimonadaceae bacterium]
MRDCLQAVRWHPTAHTALAYDVWAPINFEDGTFKVHLAERDDWLTDLSETEVPTGYRPSYDAWANGLKSDHSTCWAEVTLASRLLIGHGNSAPTEVGLTLHHTWGVPLLPGSALKGLLAHYFDAVYGGDEPERQAFRGVLWEGNRIRRGPGETYGAIFGAPDAEDDPPDCPGAVQGGLIFHDALWIPEQPTLPLAPDVLTVHQRQYYTTSQGGDWPNDYDSPIPVAFLTVAPQARFLVAITGPVAWASLALQQLLLALEEWGVGGKTAAGYGRIEPGARVHVPPHPLVAQFVAGLGLEFETHSARLDWVKGRLPDLLSLDSDQRRLVSDAVTDAVPRNKRTSDRLAAIQEALKLGQANDDPLVAQFLAELAALPADGDGVDQLMELSAWGPAHAADPERCVAAVRTHFAAPELAQTREAALELLEP